MRAVERVGDLDAGAEQKINGQRAALMTIMKSGNSSTLDIIDRIKYTQKGFVTRDMLASAQTDLASVTQAWTEATAAFQGGDVPRALKTAQDVKAKADALAGMLGLSAAPAAGPANY
jgi:hypothetical protein